MGAPGVVARSREVGWGDRTQRDQSPKHVLISRLHHKENKAHIYPCM